MSGPTTRLCCSGSCRAALGASSVLATLGVFVLPSHLREGQPRSIIEAMGARVIGPQEVRDKLEVLGLGFGMNLDM